MRLPLLIAAALVPLPAAAQDGFRPVLGGMPFDSGLALGVEYRKSNLLGGPIEFRGKAIGSTKKYEYLETTLLVPRFAHGWLFADIQARYRNYPEEEFWGLGPKSWPERRTTFRQEDIAYSGNFGVRATPWLNVGVSLGAINYNAGPGKDADRPSIEQRFTPAEVPALDRQPHYLYGGTFLRIDYRDEEADPTAGGFYQFRWTQFHNRKSGPFDFGRYELDLRHFVSPPGLRATIAARLLMIASHKTPGQSVPFFLQPTVGGGGDLRGYHQYRFRDNNSLVANLEYRWRIREIVQVVPFADAARVFPRPGDIGVAGMRGSIGAGGRVRFGTFLFGADLGWSPDGFRVWFRGSHTF